MSPLAMVLALPGAAVVMVALPMTGVITMSEALVGLSDPNIVLIAALSVIGEALVRTGVAQRLGNWPTVGPWRAIRKLADERRDLILLDLPAKGDEAVPARHRATLAIGVLALVVVPF
ncbi:MAG: hypothetical protein JJU24_08285 [Natronohydrobacter sp.]|nr:hypothetical protein [Natronohydrobacter sp.]